MAGKKSKGSDHDGGKKDGGRSALAMLPVGLHGDMTMKEECSSANSGKQEQRFTRAKVQESFRMVETTLERRRRRQEQWIRPNRLQRRQLTLSAGEENCQG